MIDTLRAQDAVAPVLDAFFSERLGRKAGPAYQLLWQRLREASDGGKRVRPHLLMLAHDTLGGTSEADAVIAAAAFELLHTALLLHDDVLDGDLVRRGRPNLQGAFAGDARESGLNEAAATNWGEAAGLLAGDLLLSGLHTLLSRIQSPLRAELHELVDDCLFATAAGELADIGFAIGAVAAEPEIIETMMRDKTAAYSFAAPLRAGALLAGATAEAERELSDIGSMLGFIYQLRDDLLGVFGSAERLGKPVDGDLREGKRTLLVSFAEGSAQWDAAHHLFGDPSLDAVGAQRLRDAIADSGSRARAQRLLTERCDEVCERIYAAPLPESLQGELVRLAWQSAERDA